MAKNKIGLNSGQELAKNWLRIGEENSCYCSYLSIYSNVDYRIGQFYFHNPIFMLNAC